MSQRACLGPHANTLTPSPCPCRPAPLCSCASSLVFSPRPDVFCAVLTTDRPVEWCVGEAGRAWRLHVLDRGSCRLPHLVKPLCGVPLTLPFPLGACSLIDCASQCVNKVATSCK